jgi:hypothetical protein
MAHEPLTATPDENERARLLSEFKFIKDLESRMLDAHDDGREEGQNRVLDLLRQGLSVAEIERQLTASVCD